MTLESSRHDHALGMLCLIACPALSGVFLGLVAILCTYPSGGGHALAVGTRVGAVAFVTNALVICLTASAVHQRAAHKAHEGARAVLEDARSRM